MYVFPAMLKMTKVKFPSAAHRKVAETVLLCNPQYVTLGGLTHGASVIAAIPADRIKKVTAGDLYALGIKLP